MPKPQTDQHGDRPIPGVQQLWVLAGAHNALAQQLDVLTNERKWMLLSKMLGQSGTMKKLSQSFA
jgi:hypothetical protein